jgi:uncharacterized membrane protein SirB2
MSFALLKTVHVTCVVVTFVLFSGRGALMCIDLPIRRARWLRIVPHVNDTLLLASAVWMTVLSDQYPFVNSWLTAKLSALVVYIVVGMVALSERRPKRVRVAAWICALLVFAYIVSVALNRNPIPFS